MKKLIKLLNWFNLDKAIEMEYIDEQFLSLQFLYKNKKISDSDFLLLIVLNSIVCYQLSSKGEDYWKEFSDYFRDVEADIWIINSIKDFLLQSKWNRRIIPTKIKRLEKAEKFIIKLKGKELFFYENMNSFIKELAQIMNQKESAKTIVFALKMFSYWSRVVFKKTIVFPKEIMIPIDSRLEKIFEQYKWDYTNINLFYLELSQKLNIPMLHLDAVLWLNNNKILNKQKILW